MVFIKKQEVKAYILLESLVTIALLGVMSLVVLREVSVNRSILAQQNKAIEELNVALMAFDTKQAILSANGVTVSLVTTDKMLVITNESGEVLRLEMLHKTP